MSTPSSYLAALDDERRGPMTRLHRLISKRLPAGFEITIASNMLAYVVPLSKYPKGYHANPKQPLPFINLASQKSHIALYHLGLMADAELLRWFTAEWKKTTSAKLDLGKSCLRLKKLDAIPYELIGELASQRTPKEWIATYEKALSPSTSKKRA